MRRGSCVDAMGALEPLNASQSRTRQSVPYILGLARARPVVWSERLYVRIRLNIHRDCFQCHAIPEAFVTHNLDCFRFRRCLSGDALRDAAGSRNWNPPEQGTTVLIMLTAAYAALYSTLSECSARGPDDRASEAV